MRAWFFACVPWLALLGVLLLTLEPTRADVGALEVDQPAAVVVGKPMGIAAGERVDSARRGQSTTPLPRAPRELWRRELAGGVEVSPIVDRRGSVLVALASRDLVKIDVSGEERWRTRLGGSSAAAAPALVSDGSVAVVCSDGRLRFVSPSGRVGVVVPLSMSTVRAIATPVALDDGSVVVVGDTGMVHVDRTGRELARTDLEVASTGGLIPRAGAVLVVGREGDVLEWRAPSAPVALGRFAGAPRGGAVLVGPRTLVAVLDGKRVTALDLATGKTTLLMGESDALAAYEGPPTLDANGTLLVTTLVGELFGVDGRGVVVRRSALEDLSLLFGGDAGAPPPSVVTSALGQPSPPLVADGQGLIGFVRSSGKVGVMDDAGRVMVGSPRQCARPLAVLPAGIGRMVVVCRNGSLAMYGEQL